MNFRRTLRVMPTVLIVGVTFFGILFPDQSKWIQGDSDVASATSTTLKKPHKKHTVIAIGILILGVIAVVMAALKDAKEQQNEPGHLSEEQFIERYTEALSSTLEYLPLSSIFYPSDRKEATINILKNIVNIAEAYKSDDVDHKFGMNACLYQARGTVQLTDEQLHAVTRFMDKGRTTYDVFLVLHEWAYLGNELIDPNDQNGSKHEKPCVDVGFTLPVDSVSQYTLAGAPEAYVKRQITFVSDISSKETLKQLPGMNYAPVLNEMWHFFQDRQTYLSFVNFPVVVGDQIFGVVSIQSKMKHFCNPNSSHDQNMFKSLKPFLVALALLESHSSN